MAKFAELNDNLQDVLLKLVQSQNLCKYLFYESSGDSEAQLIDPLTKPNLDIATCASLVYNHIYPFPKLPDIKDAGTYVTVHFDRIKRGDSIYWKNSVLVFTVICHISQLRLLGKQRLLSVMNEIDELFNNQSVIGIGKVQFEDARYFIPDKNFVGYGLEYKIVDFS
jgi:hypothetical protein